MLASTLKRTLILSCLVMTGLSPACSKSIVCDPCKVGFKAVANVFVRDTAGVPLGGVDIHVLAYSDNCGGRFLASEGPLRVDARGYGTVLMTIFDIGPQAAHCLRVIILPGSNATHPNGTVDFQTVLNFRDRTPTESVRLEVVVGQ